MRLDDTNFLVWQQQIEAFIKGHRLHRFVVSPEISMRFLSEKDRDEGKVNEEYHKWEKQDQFLFS